ncbi:bacteriocin fulvocin C-related protein [Flavobacterium sp.]|uniref:bacteriocin fulvocin C-related protein n=1 Tax=Flavobacterium sp. TaxID=239 RepID=UPI0035281C9C
MKKSFLTLIIIVLVLNSCSTDSELEVSKISSQKISEVVNEKNLSVQKLKYSLLSKEDKFSIWENKINNLINDNLNDEQKSLILDLKNHLNVSIFDDDLNNDTREIFKTVYSKQFLEKANTIFSEEFIITNFYYINYKFYDGENSNCNCTSQSSVTCLSTIQNPLFCKKGYADCKQSLKNCGFLLRYDCDGMCLSVHDM